jgi:hypothetical protein
MTKQQAYTKKMKAAGLKYTTAWLLPETKVKVLQLQAEDKKKATGEAK